jgi:hypothetical protein
VVSTGKREAELAQAFQPLFRSTQQVLARYSTAELELLAGFLRQFGEATEQLIQDMAAGSPLDTIAPYTGIGARGPAFRYIAASGGVECPSRPSSSQRPQR